MINLINELPLRSLVILKFRSGSTIYCQYETLAELLSAFKFEEFETITIHLVH
jgi:hypothetical protein